MWERTIHRLIAFLFVLVGWIVSSRFTHADTCTDALFSFIFRDLIWCLILITVCYIMYDVSLQEKPEKISLPNVLMFLFLTLLTPYAWIATFVFNRNVKSIRKVQEKTLLRILRLQKNTKYGMEFGFKSIRSVSEFRTGHPVVDYSHYKSYVDAAINGEPNMFFNKNIDYVATTSGTTSGKSKLFVKNVKYALSWMLKASMVPLCPLLHTKLRNRKFMRLHKISTKPTCTLTASGIRKGPITGIIDDTGAMNKMNLVPTAVFKIEEQSACFYVHALFGLKTPDISFLSFSTSSCMLIYFRLIETEFNNLCRDIKEGRIKNDLDISEDIRKKLEECLTPDPERAEVLRRAFRDGANGLVPKVWPNCVMVSGLSNSSLCLQAELVKKRFLGNVTVVSPVHVSTEGCYGISLWTPDDVSETQFVIHPTANFYEFIPEDELDKDSPDTVLAHEVEVGQTYEMVVSTWEGLYRYRTQDLIKVTGFYGTAPMYKLLQRVGDVLNLITEKLPDTMMEQALLSAATSWHCGRVVNYTSTENVYVDQIRGDVSASLHYVVFVELDSNTKLSSTEINELDQELVRLVENYGPYRKRGSIQPAQVVQVKEGTFQNLAELIVQCNPECFSGQLKIPRIIRRHDFLKLLLDMEIAT